MAAGVHPVTLARWIEAGRSSTPGGRWATFRQQVLEAEGRPPELQLLENRYEAAMATPESALRWLEALEREERPRSAPVVVEVVFAPFTAPNHGGSTNGGH